MHLQFEVVRLIAQIGGFLGRKSDGEPGAKTSGAGLIRFSLQLTPYAHSARGSADLCIKVWVKLPIEPIT